MWKRFSSDNVQRLEGGVQTEVKIDVSSKKRQHNTNLWTKVSLQSVGLEFAFVRRIRGGLHGLRTDYRTLFRFIFCVREGGINGLSTLSAK